MNGQPDKFETKATERYVDPVIEAYKPGIDRTIVRHNLQLTVEQRIDGLMSLMQSIEEMNEVGRRSREQR